MSAAVMPAEQATMSASDSIVIPVCKGGVQQKSGWITQSHPLLTIELSYENRITMALPGVLSVTTMRPAESPRDGDLP